jgi:hypothetical protein
MSGGCSNRGAKVVLTDCEISNDVDDLDGTTPANMAADKDIKIVLKQLTKAAEKKSKAGKKAPGYSGSPHMRKMVFKSNSPVVVKSPGLLKKKRVVDDLDGSFGESRRRIRFCEQGKTGAEIEPQAINCIPLIIL